MYYTVTYHFSDGRDVRERKRLSLVASGSGYLISGDTTISSANL